MLHIIIAINLLASSAFASYLGQTLKTKEECEVLIKKKYNSSTKKVFNIKHVITGKGSYATHFYYDIKFTENAGKLNQACNARIYCTSYDYEIYEDAKHCGKY